MSKEKTILFVMPRLPFPATSGRKTSLYHYCRILSEKLGYRLVVAAFLEKGDNPQICPDFIDRLEILPKPSAVTKIKNIFFDSVLLKKKPMQVSLYWNPMAKNVIDRIVQEEQPDVIIGDMVRSTEYIKNYPVYRIADLDDRISLRYQRQLDYDISSINPYGAFLETLPKFIQRFMLWKPLKIYVVKNEIALLRKYEVEIAKQCDKTVFVAQKEADELNKELHADKACAIPIGVDVDYFSYRENACEENCIGFLGAMNVAHNENAVKHFISDILPDIVKEIPEVKFLVIGAGVSEDLRKLESDHVFFTGRVDDVRDSLKKCKVFVCPMTFGSGIKTKNLEAMAMGLPVVTTTIGAENIDVTSSQECFISDENHDFADKVINIIQNTNLALQIGSNAASYIRKYWTWEEAEIKFSKMLTEKKIEL